MIIEPSPDDIEKHSRTAPEPVDAPNPFPGARWENPKDYMIGWDPARSPDQSSASIWDTNTNKLLDLQVWKTPIFEMPWRYERPENANTSLINIKYMMMVSSLIPNRMMISGIADGPTWTDEELEAYYLKRARMAYTLSKPWSGAKNRRMRRAIKRYRRSMKLICESQKDIETYYGYMARKRQKELTKEMAEFANKPILRPDDERTEERSTDQPNQETSSAGE